MTVQDFIFSNDRHHRLMRHLVFWVTYCAYFYIQSIPPKRFEEFFIGRTYYIALMNLVCFAPVFFAAVYIFIYYLLPRTLQKKKYFQFVVGFFLVYLIGTFINFFTATVFLYCTNYFPMTFQHQIEMSNYNTRWGMVIAVIALGIKLSKNWYLQQKQNLALLQNKTRAKMQLEKARIHPELLIRSLKLISTTSRTERVPSMILNLSDLLSYSLYESDCELVPLKEELQNLRYLLMLEELNPENRVEVHLQADGNTREKFTSPMIIIKLVEQCITSVYQSGCLHSILYIDLSVKEEMLSLRLSISYPEKAFKHCCPSILEVTEQRIRSSYAANDFQLVCEETTEDFDILLNLRLCDHLPNANMNLNKVLNANV